MHFYVYYKQNTHSTVCFYYEQFRVRASAGVTNTKCETWAGLLLLVHVALRGEGTCCYYCKREKHCEANNTHMNLSYIFIIYTNIYILYYTCVIFLLKKTGIVFSEP